MTGDVRVVLPVAILAGGAVVVYLIARFVTSRNHLLGGFTASVFAAALVAATLLHPIVSANPLLSWEQFDSGGASLRADPGALFIACVALGLGLLVAIYSGQYLALDQRYETFYPLLLLLVTGLVGMLFAHDLFSIYLLCELMSICAYVLVAFRRRTSTAIEAGFKYLMMGSVGTVTILLGISFIYRETGQLLLVQSTPTPGPWTRAGIACFLVGLGLKSAIVPLHTWLPDAHGRAPSSISAMLSGIVVQSAFYMLLKVTLGLGLPADTLGTLLVALAIPNMVLGNGMALVQTHTKRLLGYSTIAQMGYIMLSIGVGLRHSAPATVQAGLFMILAQATMKGLAFLCKGACHFYYGATTIEDLRGKARRMPLVAVTFGIALLGLAGIPPLAGFSGKWLILRSLLGARDAVGYVGMVVLLLNTLVALGYYLPLVGALFASPSTASDASEGAQGKQARVSAWIAQPLITLGALAILIGLYPGPWLNWTASAASYLLQLGR